MLNEFSVGLRFFDKPDNSGRSAFGWADEDRVRALTIQQAALNLSRFSVYHVAPE